MANSPSPQGPRPTLPRPVWLVSWTSFFTDTASEVVYPLMPLYLTRVLGGTALSIGIIEGAAEALNSVLKIISGRMADRWRTRKPLMIAGYAVSSAVRPLVALATTWPHVLLVRLADRVGKGVRGAPRDALIASWADPSIRGYAFGVNRAMDHAGAVVGPLLATLFLYFFPEQYRLLFALTLIPGVIAVLMLLPVPDVPPPWSPGALTPGAASDSRAATVRSPLGSSFYRYLGVLLLFSFGNSTDAFLLLRLNEAGIGGTWIPLVWAALHVVKAVASPIAGRLSDRVSRKVIITSGWVIYAGVYAGFAVVSSLPALVAVFLVYGLYYGLTEGVEKAVVADLVPENSRGNAFGVYSAVIGIGALCASLLFGGIWKFAGAPSAFMTGAVLAMASAVLLAVVPLPRARSAS
ncbi:MAG: MFS transporter [Acidobacteria bacterium]|nr:MFS transporter [Acidobacteriota bacterium]